LSVETLCVTRVTLHPAGDETLWVNLCVRHAALLHAGDEEVTRWVDAQTVPIEVPDAPPLAPWIAFLDTDSEALAWMAVVAIVVVVAIGLSMLLLWVRGRSSADHTELPAESAFPLPVIVVLGLLGATTLLISSLAADGIG
jgi:hypothetical protein